MLNTKSTAASVQNSASSFVASLSLNNKKKTENSSQGQLLSNGECKKHSAPKHMWCHTCQLWICGTCVFLKHQNQDTKQKPKCNVALLSEALKDLKTLQCKKILSQMNILSQIDSCLKFLLTENSSSAQKWKEIVTRQRNIKEDIDILDEALESIDSDASVVGKIHALDYVKNLLDAKCYPMTEEDILKGFWQLFMKKTCFDSKMMNFTWISLAVSCEVGGRRKYAKARRHKNLIIFPCVDTVPRAFGTICFHLSDLFVTGMHTFKLANRNDFIGYVIFRLFGNNQRARHFRMLCSGEAGPSYQGTRFFEKKGVYCQYLSGGDYENNNGSGGLSLFTFDEEDDDSSKMKKGIVCGPSLRNRKHLGQFKIFHQVPQSNNSNVAWRAFALVVHGIDLINSIVVNDEWDQVNIEECGLLFETTI